MANTLTDQAIVEIEKYRLTTNLENSIEVAPLLNDQYLKEFMGKLAFQIGAPSEKTAASIFMKRYAFLAVFSLYSMTVWNKKINISIENIKLESPKKGKDWLPLFSLNDYTVEEWGGEDRFLWRKGILMELFAHNISPLIQKLEKTFQISKLVLWENIAVYLFWLYETELKGQENDQVQEDFRYLIWEAEGSIFGRFNHNPLEKYYSEKSYVETLGEEVRVRKTCCFTYQLESSSKRCKTCPCTHIAKDGRCYDGKSICGSVRSFT